MNNILLNGITSFDKTSLFWLEDIFFLVSHQKFSMFLVRKSECVVSEREFLIRSFECEKIDKFFCGRKAVTHTSPCLLVTHPQSKES